MALSCTAVAATTTATAATVEKIEVAANSYGLADNIQDGTILHCFDWKYNDIKAELPNIAAAGFTAVQTSPVQPHDSTGTWYWAYQPLGFYIGSNEFGTKSDLQEIHQALGQDTVAHLQGSVGPALTQQRHIGTGNNGTLRIHNAENTVGNIS